MNIIIPDVCIQEKHNAISAAKRGYPLHALRFHYQNAFYLAEPIRKETCADYFLLYWTPAHFFSLLHEGKISREDEFTGLKYHYQVMYKQCTPAELRNCNQIKLSFRRPKEEYPVGKYVIVMKGN